MTATKFCSTEVPLPSIGRTLFIDGNTKISGWPEPKPNALSLPAPLTCPGSTPACRAACYAGEMGSIPPELRNRFAHNLKTIETLLNCSYSGDKTWTSVDFGSWIVGNCADVGFRWHVSGDVFSAQYAHWIVTVCLYSPSVQHWVYTRTLDALGPLLAATNLAVNLSADRDNLPAVRDTLAALRLPIQRRVRITYLWSGEPLPTLPQGSVIFPDYQQRHWRRAALPPPPHGVMICGADYFGQSAKLRCGVCTKCGNPRHVRS